jgi:hypothetical protein
MLFGLQQLFTAPKTQGSAEVGTQESNTLTNLNGEKSEFGAEMLELLKGMNPEEVKSFIADLPRDLQAQIKMALNPEVSSGTIFSPDFTATQLPKSATTSLEGKLSQNQDLESVSMDPRAAQELGFENNGKVKAESKISNLLSKFLPKEESNNLASAQRSPAIDFAPENVDAKLMNFEDFTLQKNSIKKQQIIPTYEGMNPKKELELKSTEVVHAVNPSGEGQTQGSAQFILNMMNESATPMKIDVAQIDKIMAPQFNMNNVQTSDVQTIMNQISDYIVQAKAAKEPTVNFKMNHQDLGLVDITVAKAQNASEAVSINIGTAALEGKQFFTQNLKELTNHLANAGIQVTDIKVDSTQNSKQSFDFNQQQRNADSGQKQFGSEQNQRNHDQEKRQSLWDLLGNKEAA